MNVTVEDQSTVKKTLHIQIPLEDVTRELDSAYKQLKKTAKVKGFRPGKIPRSVLERLYGKDVKDDVRSKLIQDAFIEALTETDLRVIGNPVVDPPELDIQAPYTFDAVVEVHPEIDTIDYKGLALTRTKYTISDAEIDAQLKMLRKNLARHETIQEQRPLALGDFAVIDYEGFQNGQPHEETKKTENFNTQVGQGQVVKDLDDGLVGMQVGEEKEIDVTFPDDYFNKTLAGQKLVFKVKLNEIREEILPDLDDAFAKQVGDAFESLEDLKTKIRENLENGYAKRVEQELNEQAFSQILEKTSFEVPDSLVEGELEQIINDAEQKFSAANRKLEDVGLSRETLAEKYRPTAEKQVRRHMILGKLMDQEKLEISDEELSQGFQEMADTYSQPVDFIKSYYDQNKEGLSFFKHTLLEKKALKLIIDNSEITEIEPTEKPPGGEAGPEDAAVKS
jgi:trigger factor